VPFDCELFALGPVIEGTGRSVAIATGTRAFTDFSQAAVGCAAGDVVGFRTLTGGANTLGGAVTAWFRYPI
jgi:hypothetical protein